MTRRWPRRLALGLLGALGALLASELGVRAVLGPPIVHGRKPADPLLGFRMPANVSLTAVDERGQFPYRSNSRGFPGPELPDGPPRPGVERVLLLGDSFLNPWQIRAEEWVGSALRRVLAERGSEAEVFAIACDDYGTAQELLALRRYARVAPTTVVLFFFNGNDVINDSLALAGKTSVSSGDYLRPYLVDDGGGGLELRYARPWQARLRWSLLFAHLETAWLMHQDLEDLQAAIAGARRPPQQGRIRRTGLPEEHFEIFREPVAGGDWEHAWRDAERVLLGFRDEARALGARPIVVVIPTMLQVQEDIGRFSFDDLLRQAGKPLLGEQLDWNRPDRRLEAFFEREGFAHVMMLEPLRRRLEETGTSISRWDGHLIGAGHELMGALLAARLAPGADDACFTPGEGSEPVELARLFPGETLDVDTRTRPALELFGGGFDPWEAPGGRPGGWPMRSRAEFLVPHRPGTVTLRGELLAMNRFPLEVRVEHRATPLASQTFAAAGPFELSFPVQRMAGNDQAWLLLKLALGAGGPSSQIALEVTGLRFEP